MEKNAVLLVEPPDGRIQHTRLPWGAAAVAVCSTPKAGLTAASTFRPAIVLLSLRQSESSGLHLARAVRRRLGREAIIIVYGQPTAGQRRALIAQRSQLRSKWGIDRLLAADPSGSRLGEVVAQLQQARLRQDGSLAMPAVETPTEPPRPASTSPTPAPTPLPPPISPQELRQVMAAAVRSISGPAVAEAPSISSRLLAGLRALFDRPAA